MRNNQFTKFSLLVWTILLVAFNTFAQSANAPIKSREVSDNEGIPVLTKHLPDWENARNRATYILNQTDLRNALGEQKVFDSIDFQSGTEAVTAPYEQGKLLIVEYMTPQASIEADEKINQILAQDANNSPIIYRRIGNYNAFVFEANDKDSAAALLDQIKYQKDVQWLGADPFLLKRAERAFVLTTSDIFITTTVVIVGGLGFSILAGILVGFIFFNQRAKKRLVTEEFSDAGGMIRLNLDGLTTSTSPDRLLSE